MSNSVVLTIAGFDPSSGAGVTADLFVFAAHGLFGTSCITSLTVQSTLGVRSSHPVDPLVIADTLTCLDLDLPPAGVKIGMLGTAAAVQVVCDFLEQLKSVRPHVSVVVDPVIRSSSGRELLDARGIDLLHSRLFPLAGWITPNVDELGILTGRVIANRDQMTCAATALHESLGRRMNVFAKAGHLETPDDLLLTSNETHWLAGEHITTNATHGTGCTLSSALLSRLVLGDEPLAAAHAAKHYVTRALRSATPLGHGKGPVNHRWPLCTPGSAGNRA